MFKTTIANRVNLFLCVVLVISCCILMAHSTYAAASCSSTACSNNDTISSTVQVHFENVDKELVELTCQQKTLTNALSLLKINSTSNSEIITLRSKQLEKITKVISLLTQESSFLKAVPIVAPVSRNGQPFEYSDGTRAKSCREYRNPNLPHIYSGQGNGLYIIEPSIGTIMTVYCDMTTDGGGWTLISGIRSQYAGVHFHTFEDSTAVVSSNVNSFHLKTASLLSLSTQVRAATDTAANSITTFYLSNWQHSAYCNITTALRNAIQLTPTIVNGDLPTNCVILSGSFTYHPTHFTYGKTTNNQSTGFRMGVPHPTLSGHMNWKSYCTFSYSGCPEGGDADHLGVHYSFSGDGGRNGAIFLR